MTNYKNIKLLIIITFSSFLLFSCGLYKPVDTRGVPTAAKDRAKRNIEEGRGASVGSLLKKRKGGDFEFSTSNPMWRASLEIIDFMPLTTVDYSGGIIITDWYNDSQNSNEFIKITIRFLSNNVRSDSIKVQVHRKKCSGQNNCQIKEHKSKISAELTSSILKKAALLERSSKNK
jgi:hypothetical protein|tara:strand:- start:5983 stop:6507 length:525 start_codon:yes stop_codon:yes gene_type:complete